MSGIQIPTVLAIVGRVFPNRSNVTEHVMLETVKSIESRENERDLIKGRTTKKGLTVVFNSCQKILW